MRIAFVRGPDHLLDAVDVDLERVGLDVDEHRDDAGAASGAMSAENVSAEVMTSSPGSQPRRSTASCSAEVPELTITAWRLPSSSAPRLELLDDRTDVDPGAQRRGDRLDLVLVGDRAGFGDGRMARFGHAGAYRVSR